MEQPQYHLLHRRRVEQEYARLYEDIGLGLTTWSPLAWCLRNPRVSTVIMGASRVQQLHDNLRALEMLPRLTDELVQRIDAIALPLAA
jgi:aryl-alcohol dehydrogenase-like predicted oxidoreductase